MMLTFLMVILFVLHTCFNVLDWMIIDAYKRFKITQYKRNHANFFLADYMNAQDRTK